MIATNVTDELILFNAALFSLENNQGTLIDHIRFVAETCGGVKVAHDRYFCSEDCCENTIYQDGRCRVHWYKFEKQRTRGFKLSNGNEV